MLVKANSEERLQAGPSQSWGMGHFIKLFHRDIEDYIKAVLNGVKPRAVLVAMIYFPDGVLVLSLHFSLFRPHMQRHSHPAGRERHSQHWATTVTQARSRPP